jgi:hypothetical protein
MGFNSTIIVKKKNLKCGHFDYNFSKGRCKSCANIEDSQKRIAAHEEQEEDESLSNLVAEADVWFSRYIRLLNCDEKGFAECYTSGKRMKWTELQCGHFISRSHYATRWISENCRPQSEYDNSHLRGNLEVFEKKLEAEKTGIVDWLREQAREVTKPTRDEMKQLISDLRNKVRVLEKKIKK